VDVTHYGGVGNTDIVWILDCCYAHKGYWDPSTSGRIVEIISATNNTTPQTLTPPILAPPAITLTRKLRTKIAKRKHDGHQTIEIAEVTQSLRDNNPNVRPSHSLKKGVLSVRLSLSGVLTITPCTTRPFLRVVFTVHIVESMTCAESEEFDGFKPFTQTMPWSSMPSMSRIPHFSFSRARQLFTQSMLEFEASILFLRCQASTDAHSWTGRNNSSLCPP
jgi:hypothetical protein